MKTTFKIVDHVLTLLLANKATIGITGNIYRNGERPVNSDTEDIVISSLPITADQVQRSLLNINVHVPNKTLMIGGIVNTMPDFERLEVLTNKVIPVVDEKYINDYWFFVQQHHQFLGETDSYSNIRIEFYSENIN